MIKKLKEEYGTQELRKKKERRTVQWLDTLDSVPVFLLSILNPFSLQPSV